MVKINWSVYFLLGIAVLITSYRIDPQRFRLFIWLAYLFLIIGSAKFIVWFITRNRETSAERKKVKTNIPQFQQQRTEKQQQTIARYCPRCGNVLHKYENFCPMCGQRLM